MNYIGIIRKINGRNTWGFGALAEMDSNRNYVPTRSTIIPIKSNGELHNQYEELRTLFKAQNYMDEGKDDIMRSGVPFNKDSIKDVVTDTYTKTKKVKNVDKSTKPYKVTYDDVTTEYTKVTIKWIDDTETSVECPTSEYSPYYGFAIAVAKKAMGNDNTMSNLADYWMNKIPKKRSAKEKVLAEKKRIAEKREAERKERFEHRKAKKLMMDRVRAYKEYVADMKIRKEAYEKYGVPEGFNIPKDNE